jgi:hypothetical protein
MPTRVVPVRSHYRDTEHKRVHVRRHSREVDAGASRQYDLDEALGPEHDILGRNDPEGETCTSCGYQQPVYQRTVLGAPLCRECALAKAEGQLERRKERERQGKAIDKRLREWDRWQRGEQVEHKIRRS